MKRILALFLAFSMILPVFATGDILIAPAPTEPAVPEAPIAPAPAEPEAPAAPAEPEPPREPTEADLAPKALYTLTGDHGLDLGTGNLLLVNYDHQVSADYAPADLVTFSGGRVLKPSMDLRRETKTAYEQMSKAMDKAGLKLYICSGFRTYDYQTGLFTKRLQSRINSGMGYAEAFAATNLYTAYPGTSEHETGMAIDLAKDIYAELNDYFGTTPVGKWLYANCADYGFILRYTKEKQDVTRIGYEPWHFRYVGLPHSRIITEQGWAFEEYLQHLQQGNVLTRTEEDGVWTIRYTTDYSAISKMKNVQSYSYDNCGGWVVTCWKENTGYYVGEHWSKQYFDTLLAGRGYQGDCTVVPDQPIPVEGFQYLYSLIPGLQQPLWGDLQYVSRQSAAVAMAGIFGFQNGEAKTYLDEHLIAPWAKTSVYKLTALGILQGTTDGRFNPEATITWAEAATMLARLKVHLGK